MLNPRKGLGVFVYPPMLCAVFYFLLCFALWVFLPIAGPNGGYNTITGLTWCKPDYCAHEAVHKLDHLSGWVSHSNEFKNAVDEIGWTHGENYQEKYVRIFLFSKGKKENMPPQLQPFYNWDLSEKLLSELWPTSQR